MIPPMRSSGSRPPGGTQPSPTLMPADARVRNMALVILFVPLLVIVLALVAVHAAVSSEPGVMTIPNPNYTVPSSFGSLELRQRPNNEFIGQAINYTENTAEIRKVALDEFNLPRVDFIKLDVEGMELEALEGADKTIKSSRPILLIEKIKSNAEQLQRWFGDRGYVLREIGINVLAIHSDDKTLTELNPAKKAP